MLHKLANATDKYEAAVAMQPGAARNNEDIRLLDHPKHAAFQQLRGKIEIRDHFTMPKDHFTMPKDIRKAYGTPRPSRSHRNRFGESPHRRGC
jgi:hypothetical protein